MKSSSFLLSALVPVAFHVHGSGNAGRTVPATRAVLDSVRDVSVDGDTTYITRDSATHLIQASPAQVIFLRVGSNPGVRITKKKLAKVNLASVTDVQLDKGQPFLLQYGNDAKSGVLTITIPQPPAKKS